MNFFSLSSPFEEVILPILSIIAVYHLEEIKDFFHSFKKLYFIDYAITVVLIFPLCPSQPSTPYSLRQSHAIVHVHGPRI